MHNRRNELLLEAAILAVAVWLIGRQAHALLIAPRQAELAALTTELADLRENKAWGKGLRARLASSEAAYPKRLALLKEIDAHFLHEENDRLRILDAWDRAIKQSPTLRAQPEPATDRVQSTEFRSSEPLGEEANDLRRKFAKLYPHDELTAWKAPPDSIPVTRLDERLRLTGPYPEIFRFLERLQSDALFFEITHFSARQDGASSDEPLQATVAISAALFPRERR